MAFEAAADYLEFEAVLVAVDGWLLWTEVAERTVRCQAHWTEFETTADKTEFETVVVVHRLMGTEAVADSSVRRKADWVLLRTVTV